MISGNSIMKVEVIIRVFLYIFNFRGLFCGNSYWKLAVIQCAGWNSTIPAIAYDWCRSIDHNTCPSIKTLMSEVLREQSRGHSYTRVWTVHEIARDEALHSVCVKSLHLTMLTSPDPAGDSVGRARVVARWGVQLVFFSRIFVPISRVYWV